MLTVFYRMRRPIGTRGPFFFKRYVSAREIHCPNSARGILSEPEKINARFPSYRNFRPNFFLNVSTSVVWQWK
jgi:hypothetical protein